MHALLRGRMSVSRRKGRRVITEQELNECLSLSKEVREVRERTEEIRALAERVTTTYSQIASHKSGVSNKVETGGIKIQEYLQGRETLIETFVRTIHRIEKEIDSIKESDIRRCMRFRYIDGYGILEITVRMGLSKSTIIRMLKEGIQEVS